MSEVRFPVMELRQYTLHSGGRDVLIDIFETHYVESQEMLGMTLVGQFRDLDDPDRFVWLRGFQDMPSRGEGLRAFYTGEQWRAHASEANETMIDSDNVLLLRPVDSRAGFPAPAAPRPDGERLPAGVVVATSYFRDHPFDDVFADFFEDQLRPVLAETGAQPLARLQTEYAENNYPSLPVRTGEHTFIWFARFDSAEAFEDHRERLSRHDGWMEKLLPQLETQVDTVEQLRLAPTARSLLR